MQYHSKDVVQHLFTSGNRYLTKAFPSTNIMKYLFAGQNKMYLYKNVLITFLSTQGFKNPLNWNVCVLQRWLRRR